MKHSKRFLILLLSIIAVICTLTFVPWKALGLWTSPLPDSVQGQATNAVKYGLDGIIVYIDGEGRAPELYSAGWRDREKKIPADPNALFKIASISKLYMAAAATKLVYTKTLSLDRTLANYLPELAARIENSDQITLRMMLQHRSGIPDFINSPQLPWSNLPTDANQFLALVLDKKADFKPNRRYEYSNTNYLLIGRIMDNALGYSHNAYIKKEILLPLKLTHTYGTLSEVNLNELMSGYYTEYAGDLKTQNYVSPGGSMVATITDVGKFLSALNDGSLLNRHEQELYSTLYPYEHTGLLPGYSSIARYHKDIDRVVVQFVNTSGADSWTVSEMVYNRIVRIVRKRHQ